jgi:hypothetical protein
LLYIYKAWAWLYGIERPRLKNTEFTNVGVASHLFLISKVHLPMIPCSSVYYYRYFLFIHSTKFLFPPELSRNRSRAGLYQTHSFARQVTPSISAGAPLRVQLEADIWLGSLDNQIHGKLSYIEGNSRIETKWTRLQLGSRPWKLEIWLGTGGTGDLKIVAPVSWSIRFPLLNGSSICGPSSASSHTCIRASRRTVWRSPR